MVAVCFVLFVFFASSFESTNTVAFSTLFKFTEPEICHGNENWNSWGEKYFLWGKKVDRHTPFSMTIKRMDL